MSGVIHTTVSTWRQPTPTGASAQRQEEIEEVAADLLARGAGRLRNAFDYDALSRLLLEPFAAADGAGCALCSIDPLTQVDHSTELTPVEADAVLVVDGVFALRPELDHHWDYRIWLDVPEDASLSRGRARDGAVAGHLHETRYLPAERIYLAEADPMQRADVVIDNADFDRPRLR